MKRKKKKKQQKTHSVALNFLLIKRIESSSASSSFYIFIHSTTIYVDVDFGPTELNCKLYFTVLPEVDLRSTEIVAIHQRLIYVTQQLFKIQKQKSLRLQSTNFVANRMKDKDVAVHDESDEKRRFRSFSLDFYLVEDFHVQSKRFSCYRKLVVEFKVKATISSSCFSFRLECDHFVDLPNLGCHN